MKDTFEHFITVTMHIKARPTENDKWHIKFDRDIVQIITLPKFAFSSTSMNVAITKVADLVARHPEHYFNEITIK